jgi:hypothetical protein
VGPRAETRASCCVTTFTTSTSAPPSIIYRPRRQVRSPFIYHYRITSSAATADNGGATNGHDDNSHDGNNHDRRKQTAAFARRWTGLAQTRRTGPVFKF